MVHLAQSRSGKLDGFRRERAGDEQRCWMPARVAAVSELALVRWLKPGDGPMYIVGCAFVRPVSQKVLEEFFGSAQK